MNEIEAYLWKIKSSINYLFTNKNINIHLCRYFDHQKKKKKNGFKGFFFFFSSCVVKFIYHYFEEVRDIKNRITFFCSKINLTTTTKRNWFN